MIFMYIYKESIQKEVREGKNPFWKSIDELLQCQADHGRLLRGSSNNVNVLCPDNTGKSDTPRLYATDCAFAAIFYAIRPAGTTPKLPFNDYWFLDLTGSSPVLNISSDMYNYLHPGYVYVLDSEAFKTENPHHPIGIREYYTTKSINPLGVIPVFPGDFRHEIRVLDDQGCRHDIRSCESSPRTGIRAVTNAWKYE